MKADSHRILVIDDEPEIIRAVRLTITLQAPAWQVIDAPDGQQGLERIALEAPDLVLLDLSMPGMHGFDVLKEIRLTSTVPVIFLTVEDDELAKVRGLQWEVTTTSSSLLGTWNYWLAFALYCGARQGTRNRWNSLTSTVTCRSTSPAGA